MRIFFLILTIIIFQGSVYAKTITFVQLSDVHVTKNGADTATRAYSESVGNLKKAIEFINKMCGVDFVIFSGDNINEPNKYDLALLGKMSKKLNVPYYMTLGDHDVSTTQKLDKKEYYRFLNKFSNNKIPKLPHAQKIDNNLVFIYMDGSNQFIPGPHGYYKEKEIIWLEQKLTKYKNQKVVIIQHFPLVEPFKYKSHTTYDGEKYISMLKKHKNVISIISGHYHSENEITQDGILNISCPSLLTGEFKRIEINYGSKPNDYVIKTKMFNINE